MTSLILLLKDNILFIRFIAVGLINTIFGYGLYLTCLYIGFNYMLAALISTILGVIFNFFTTGRLVFSSNDNSLIFKFIFVYLIIYFFTILGITVLNLFTISYEIAGAFMILPNAILAFFLNKSMVFNHEKIN